ncbi:MAG: hypothetical protein PHT50_00465 [Candidatus Omnitrophica bacterium]|nr:hypothetical protein [Candidatus Omnitrophota bacterium]
MIEKITHNGNIIALIIRKGYKPEALNFFSLNDYPLQLGAMSRPKGYQIMPHMHKPIKRVTTHAQEVLVIKSGQVRIDFYSLKRVFLRSRKLNAGDIIFIAGAGHAFKFITKAVIFEIKNGPYLQGVDKVNFTPKVRVK